MRSKKWARTTTLIAAVLFLQGVAWGEVIGRNTPAQSLTCARIAGLPRSEQQAWRKYLEHSARKRAEDKAALAAELKTAHLAESSWPEHSHGAHSIPLRRDFRWYATEDARRVAENLVSYQTPAGGWGKNTEMGSAPRRMGERYAVDNVSELLAPGDFDTPAERTWNYIGTIDNDATTTQLAFLAKVIGASPKVDTTPLRASFNKGIEYLLEAQYPNGGWPQVWPLEGGYHDAITFNDNAMAEVMELLRHTAEGADEYAFVAPELRRRAAKAVEGGVACILASQIRANGVLTGWPQQEDPLTLRPVSARNYEMPAISSGESSDLLILLMETGEPTAAEQRAIRSAEAWLKRAALRGELHGYGVAEGETEWARFYQIGTDKPIFGDRDKTIHDRVEDLSEERRHGYGWYGNSPRRALELFVRWEQKYPESK